LEPDLFTTAAQAGSERGEGAFSAPPLVPSSAQLGAGDPAPHPFAYMRMGNPTWSALEQALGALENAHALCFASGQAASSTLLLALGESRSRLVLPSDGYYGTRKLAALLATRGIETVLVDQADPDRIERALSGGNAILWCETPTNPFLRVFDLERLAGLARAHGSPLVVDNTTATAVLQRPLDLGATATITSLTKAASGHSDVILGAVATRDQRLLERLNAWRSGGGGIAGPFEAWLALRGLRTLPLRIERQSNTALALARHLSGHPRVRRVHYPGLEPATLALASRQMPRGFGPLLSFELDGDAQSAEKVVRAARHIRPATSFGGVESSWERRARWSSETAPESLIRLSVGLEEPDDLRADLDRALAVR
jgi:cystathionine gamma-synthase